VSLYDCDWDSDRNWDYLERIEISDGTVKCCESGIVIPAGQPFAMCMVYCHETDVPEGCCLDELPAERRDEEFWKHAKPFPQCLEVWRYLRNGNYKWGACAAFGCAVEQYHDAWSDSGEDVDKLRSLGLIGTIKKARKRYESGGGPTLHPNERDSLENNKWFEAIGYTLRPAPSQPLDGDR